MVGGYSKCLSCGKDIEMQARGRPRRFCSPRCRTAHHRRRRDYFESEQQFEAHWEGLLGYFHIQNFAPETLEIVKRITRVAGDGVGALTVQAIRTEANARRSAKSAKARSRREASKAIDATIIYPQEDPDRLL